MKQPSPVILAIAGAGLIGIAIGEHLNHRSAERRYREALESRHQLEQQVSGIVAAHDHLTQTLAQERQRSQALADSLASAQTQLEDTRGKFAEESRQVGELKLRLADVQQQLDRLQGELALLHQDAGAAASAAKPVELERIVVSQAGADGWQGRVLSIDPQWNFIVVNLGWDTVKLGDTMSVFRNGQLLAKARVERVQENICAAAILPEWTTQEIHINDVVRVL